jgi:hypothetical protein
MVRKVFHRQGMYFFAERVIDADVPVRFDAWNLEKGLQLFV